MRSVPAALAVSLFATAAQGAVLGTIQVDTAKYVSGNLPGPGARQQWRVYLRQNQLYAIHGQAGGFDGIKAEGGRPAANSSPASCRSWMPRMTAA